MTRRATTLSLFLLPLLIACAANQGDTLPAALGPDEPPEHRYLRHIENTAVILETHRQSPDAAFTALREYRARHAADIDASVAELASLKEKLTEAEHAARMEPMRSEVERVMQRLMEVMVADGYAGHPDLEATVMPIVKGGSHE